MLRAECTYVRQEIPYASVSEWVRELTDVKLDQALPEAVELVANALGEWGHPDEERNVAERLGELATGRASRVQDEGEEAHNRALVFSGLRHLFARAAAEGPLVVVLDGLQWCDQRLLKRVPSLSRYCRYVVLILPRDD